MDRLFAYGILQDPSVFLSVIGRVPESAPAFVRDYSARPVAGATYPGLIPCPGAHAHGRIYFGLTEAELKRLDAFEGEFYERIPISAIPRSERTEAAAWAYCFREGHRHRLESGEWTFERYRQRQSGVQPLDWAATAGLMVYASSVTVTPVCLVILARELAFSLTAAGSLEVARSLLVMVALILSGFLAGRFGKARSLGYSALVLGFGMLVYTVAPAYGVVVIALALLGVGGGVLEALINPLVQDLHPHDSGRYLNMTNGFWSVGVLGTVLITGDLLTRDVSWRYVVAGLGCLSALSGILFLAFNRRLHKSPRQSLREVLANKKEILLTPRFWLFYWMMFLAGAVEGAYTFWSASLIQLDYGGLPRAGGIGTAFFAGGMIAGRFAGAVWIPQQGLRRLVLLSAIAGLPVGFAIPLIGSLPLAYGALFVAGLTVACFWPSIQSYAVDRLGLEVTSLFILLSCGGIPGFAFASWIMGWIGDHAGLRVSFFLVPMMLALLIATVLCERVRLRRP